MQENFRSCRFTVVYCNATTIANQYKLEDRGLWFLTAEGLSFFTKFVNEFVNLLKITVGSW